MALLSVILAAALMMGLGLSIVLIGTTEATLAAQDRTARALREASLAAVHLAVADLRLQANWSAVLEPGVMPPWSAAPGRGIDASPTPAAPWGGALLDLRILTAAVTAAAGSGTGDPQVWRLYESGSLQALVPGVPAAPCYIAAWVADDPADGDGAPLLDRNGILAIRAVAYGPGAANVATVVTVQKTVSAGLPDSVRILTVRPLS